MSFGAPLFLLAGTIAASLVVALHFLARRDPRPLLLPTARFVPESPERAPALATTPTERVLLLLRVLAVSLAAIAFARPEVAIGKRALVRIILADTSWGASHRAAVDSIATTLRRDGDRLIEFGPGLSAGLIAGIAEARRVAAGADSVVLVVVSPIARGQLDSATLAIRRGWPGGLDWRAVSPPARLSDPLVLTTPLPATSPLAATLTLLGAGRADSARLRLLLGPADGADSAWARGAGHRLVVWDQSIERPDPVGALITADAVTVGDFRRGVEPSPGDGRAIGWWVDGRVAATESRFGDGCLRVVDATVPAAGDLVLRPAFAAMVRDLLAPCSGAVDASTPDSIALRAIVGTAPVSVATASLANLPRGPSPAVPWLIGAALLALVVEQRLRSRTPR